MCYTFGTPNKKEREISKRTELKFFEGSTKLKIILVVS